MFICFRQICEERPKLKFGFEVDAEMCNSVDVQSVLSLVPVFGYLTFDLYVTMATFYKVGEGRMGTVEKMGSFVFSSISRKTSIPNWNNVCLFIISENPFSMQKLFSYSEQRKTFALAGYIQTAKLFTTDQREPPVEKKV